MTAFHDWLHALPIEHVQALRDFRSAAKAAHPGALNAMANALDEGTAPAMIAQMPRAFVIALNHERTAPNGQ